MSPLEGVNGVRSDLVARIGLAAGRRVSGQTRAIFKQSLNQPQFQIGPIGVRVQQGPKLPPL